MFPARVPGHVGRPIERVRLSGGRRRSESRRDGHALNRFRPMTEQHHDAPFGIELDHHVGAFVDGPDVVLRIHPDSVSEREAVQTFADFADKVSFLRRTQTGGCPGCGCKRKHALWNWSRRRCLRRDTDSPEASGSSARIRKVFRARSAPWPWRRICAGVRLPDCAKIATAPSSSTAIR